MGQNSDRLTILIAILVVFAVLYLWAQGNNPQLANQMEQLARQMWRLLGDILQTVINFVLYFLDSVLRMLINALSGFDP